VTAKIIGGELKTIPDKESQSAAWFDLPTVLLEVKNGNNDSRYRKPWELDFIFSTIFNNEGTLKTTIPII